MDLFSPHGLFFPIVQAVSSLRAIRRIFRSARSSSTAEHQQSRRSVSLQFIRSNRIIPQTVPAGKRLEHLHQEELQIVRLRDRKNHRMIKGRMTLLNDTHRYAGRPARILEHFTELLGRHEM